MNISSRQKSNATVYRKMYLNRSDRIIKVKKQQIKLEVKFYCSMINLRQAIKEKINTLKECYVWARHSLYIDFMPNHDNISSVDIKLIYRKECENEKREYFGSLDHG